MIIASTFLLGSGLMAVQWSSLVKRKWGTDPDRPKCCQLLGFLVQYKDIRKIVRRENIGEHISLSLLYTSLGYPALPGMIQMIF